MKSFELGTDLFLEESQKNRRTDITELIDILRKF